MKLQDRVAIVTGGGAGIGKAVAVEFALQGARVVVANRTERTGEDTVSLIAQEGGDAAFVRTDVCRSTDVKALVESTVKRFGRVDVLVNNAGVWEPKSLLDLDEESWDRVIDTNLKGQYLCARHVAPSMIRQGGGTIINVSSTLGVLALEENSSYSATKAGILALTKVWALELARFGIRVNCLVPGTVDTPMTWQGLTESEKADIWRGVDEVTPLGRIGSPEDMAKAAVFLASEDSSYMTGAPLFVDGGQLSKLAAVI